MASIKRAAAAIATILVREGIDYAQSKAVFKAARQRAGLRAPPERRGGVDRLTVEEELRFLDLGHGAKVFERIQRQHLIVPRHEDSRASAILGRAGAATAGASGIGLASFRLQSIFYANLMVPGDIQVVLVNKPRALAEPQRNQRHVGRRS